MSLQAIELNSDDGQRSGHGNFQFCAKRLRYSCRVALCAFFRLCEVPRCGGDHGNSLSSTAAATSPSSTAAWRCLTTPDCAPHSNVRVDSAGTRAIGTTVRSHPQLLNGRLRSTTTRAGEARGGGGCAQAGAVGSCQGPKCRVRLWQRQSVLCIDPQRRDQRRSGPGRSAQGPS